MSSVAPILVLVGTKAQFIKTAPILREMDARSVPYRLIYTGQHSETFLLLERAFDLRQADDVLVPRFEAATKIGFLEWTLRYWWAVLGHIRRGDWRGATFGLVHGDTASTLFGALALRMAGVKVAHVEAGLRSERLLEPFPEEIVRRLVSRLSHLHLAPDAHATANLAGVSGRVVDTRGNTLRDALMLALQRLGEAPVSAGECNYAVVSMHRSENLGRRRVLDFLLGEILHAADTLPIRFVLHPVTRTRIASSGWLERLQAHPNLSLIDRMDYPDFVRLLLGARFLMTDGGSNQEEAAMLGLPTLLLRRATERSDGLGDNVVMSGLQRDSIRAFVSENANARWQLRSVSGPSPSSIVVDSLAG